MLVAVIVTLLAVTTPPAPISAWTELETSWSARAPLAPTRPALTLSTTPLNRAVWLAVMLRSSTVTAWLLSPLPVPA